MRSATDRVAGITVYVLAFLLGAAVGLVGSFQQATTVSVAGVALPLGLVAGLAASVAAVVGAGLLTGSRIGAALAFVGWLASTTVMSLKRPEGDLVVPATVHGLVWLFAGTVLGGLCLAWPYGTKVRLRRQPLPPSRGDGQDAGG